jgi:hypothetical protein
MWPQIFYFQFAVSIFLAQREQFHPRSKAIGNVAVNFCRNLAVPPLRFNDAGQGDVVAVGWCVHVWDLCRPYGTRLLDDLEIVALASAVAGSAQQRAQSTGGAALAPDNFADVAFGDFQFDDAVVEQLDEDFVGRVDQRLGDAFDQDAHISSGLSHSSISLWN